MSRESWLNVAAGALAAALVNSACGQEEPGKVSPLLLREFAAVVEQALPNRGSVIAVYEPTSQTVYGRTTVGFDAQSRAWFFASWKSAIGRDPSGKSYRSQGESPQLVDWASGESLGGLGIADYIPIGYLDFLRANPQAITSLERTSSGAWLVWYSQPGLESLAPSGVEIDPTGTPVRRWREDPKDRRESEFLYSPESPPGFPLAMSWGSETQSVPRPVLTHVEFHANGNPALFERSAVESTAIDNRVIVETKRQAIAAGFTRNEDGTWNPPDQTKVKPYSGDDLRAYRWPLVLAGVTLVVLAGFEIVRRRKGV